MGIRKRLLALSIGIAIPLILVGLVMLWALWQESRKELNHSIEEQSQLAAVAFEKWIDGQRQPLSTLAAMVAERPRGPFPFEARLSYVVQTRPHWLDVRVLDDAGEALLTHSPDPKGLRVEIIRTLQNEVRRRNSWSVVTDWSRGEGYPVLALAVPIANGGMIVARIDGAAIGELFRNIQLPDNAVIAVFDSERRVLYRSATENTYLGTDRSDSPLFAPLKTQSNAVIETTSPYDGVERIYGLVVVGSTDCVVATGVPTSTLYSPARRQITRYLVFSLLALLCAIAAAILIAQNIARPILKLSQAAKEFGRGELKARAHLKDRGELEELGAAFDEMAQSIETRTLRLAELDRLKSEFVGGVSHELRTPLTTIKTLTRVLLRGRETQQERREYLETIAAECDRQIDLVLNLLDLSRIEAGAFTVSREKVDVAEVLRNCATIEHQAASIRSHVLEVQLANVELFAAVDANAVRRVLCSLIENSIKYTPDGGRITLSSELEGEDVVIRIADTGCGIEAADVPHVFDKFYRGRPSNPVNNGANTEVAESEAPGIGLGLYLARTIIEEFGGRILVETSSHRGTTMKIRLPRYRESKEIKEEQFVEASAHR
ncbi:MAG TPA: ATP-binding protein [Pyrinomonadaceae bacterium]|nr:ATP-binding protein [Pyrinomonadaceae bacterium]